MTVRDATPRDLDSIQEFLQAYVDEFWDRPYSPDALVARGHAHTGREWHHPRPRPRGPRRSRSVGSVRPRCGWDLALIGLGLHIESGSAVDPETALAFSHLACRRRVRTTCSRIRDVGALLPRRARAA